MSAVSRLLSDLRIPFVFELERQYDGAKLLFLKELCGYSRTVSDNEFCYEMSKDHLIFSPFLSFRNLSSFFFIFNKLYSSEEFEVSSKIPVNPLPSQTHSLPNTPHLTVHLLQLMNLQGHTIMTQSPQFASGFALSVVRSMGLDKRTMTCIYHYSFKHIVSKTQIFHIQYIMGL